MVKKITIKKNKKLTKTQKQKQTQKQNVTVNIGTNITKKRARTSPQKKQPTTQQPIIAPSFQSLNQPIFKQPTQQPTSLASSILATQSTPANIKKEEIQQTSLQKALQEQNTQINEPVSKANDLERVRSERIKKFDKEEDELVRSALFSQILSDRQDDTEELSQIFDEPKQPKIEFISSSTQTFSPNIFSGPLSNLPPITSRKELGLLSGRARLQTQLDDAIREKFDAQQQLLFGRLQAEESLTQAEEPLLEPEVDPEIAAQQENVLKQIQERGAAELITETPSESTPLTQPTVELGFGGLEGESIQTSVGQFLPSEPVSQGVLEVKETKKPPKTILQPISNPPSILQGQAAEDQIISAQPVKKSTRDQFSSMSVIDIIKYLNSENDNVYTLRNGYGSNSGNIEIYRNGKLVTPTIATLKTYARNKVKASIKTEEPSSIEERSGIEL